MSKSAAPIILWLLVCVNVAFGCECSNSTPIQQTSAQYRDRAVFTAHVIQLVGRTHDFKNEPRRMSSSAFAVVKQRYWGLPWYWPRIVLLDGSYPCDIAMAEGEDYLVSGQRVRYGVLAVNLCSRTQPLKGAEIDLRTLDGSRCAGPGGTLIGRVVRETDPFHPSNSRTPNVFFTLRDQDGKDRSALSDADGIYELQHLPPGPYTLESDLGGHQYASLSWYSLSTASDPLVTAGACGEVDVFLKKYDFSGRLLPGLGERVTVKLVGGDANSAEIRSDSVEPDGRFYFSNVPDGTYFLVFTSGIVGEAAFYYPGTYDRKKATRIRIVNHLVADASRLDFNPDTLPLVAVLVEPDSAINMQKFSWDAELIGSNYINDLKRFDASKKAARVYGSRGARYKVQLHGRSNQYGAYDDCVSEPVNITAEPGLIVHVKIPASCQ